MVILDIPPEAVHKIVLIKLFVTTFAILGKGNIALNLSLKLKIFRGKIFIDNIDTVQHDYVNSRNEL